MRCVLRAPVGEHHKAVAARRDRCAAVRAAHLERQRQKSVSKFERHRDFDRVGQIGDAQILFPVAQNARLKELQQPADARRADDRRQPLEMVVGRRNPDRSVGRCRCVTFEAAAQQRDVARVERADLTLFVNSVAACATGDLADLVGREQAILDAVEFFNRGEDEPPDRQVEPETDRIRRDEHVGASVAEAFRLAPSHGRRKRTVNRRRREAELRNGALQFDDALAREADHCIAAPQLRQRDRRYDAQRVLALERAHGHRHAQAIGQAPRGT